MSNYKKIEFFLAGLFLAIVLIITIIYMKRESGLVVVIPKGNNERLQNRIETFAVSKGVKVKVVEINEEKYYSYILESRKLKIDEADIFLVNNLTLGRFIEEKIVRKIGKKNFEEIVPEFLTGVEYKGRFYGYPYRAKCTMVYYNRNYFEQSSITDGELLNNGGDKFDITFNSEKLMSHYFWFYYFGGRDSNVKKGIREFYPVLKREIGFLQKNFIFYDEEKTEKQFSSQKVKLYVSDSDYIASIKNLEFSVDYGLINNKLFKPIFEVESFAISKKGFSSRAARELIKYLGSDESQRYFTDDEWFIPSNKRIFYRFLNKVSKECEPAVKEMQILPVGRESIEFEEKLKYIMIRTLKKNESIESAFSDI